MPRFYGTVGYVETREIAPDVWKPEITEYSYYGDILQNSRRLDETNGVNDDFKLNNRFSVVADPYAYEHYSAIRYVCWMGSKWKVTSVEVQRPRLILSIGGLYNGNET